MCIIDRKCYINLRDCFDFQKRTPMDLSRAESVWKKLNSQTLLLGAVKNYGSLKFRRVSSAPSLTQEPRPYPRPSRPLPFSVTTKHCFTGPTWLNNSSSCSLRAEGGRRPTNRVNPAMRPGNGGARLRAKQAAHASQAAGFSKPSTPSCREIPEVLFTQKSPKENVVGWGKNVPERKKWWLRGAEFLEWCSTPSPSTAPPTHPLSCHLRELASLVTILRKISASGDRSQIYQGKQK